MQLMIAAAADGREGEQLEHRETAREKGELGGETLRATPGLHRRE
jgi:hypothetical protein